MEYNGKMSDGHRHRSSIISSNTHPLLVTIGDINTGLHMKLENETDLNKKCHNQIVAQKRTESVGGVKTCDTVANEDELE